MADFDNIPIEVSAEDLENVAKRPYKIVARPPTGLDTGETGQWWIEIDNETEEVVQIYQRVGFEWVSYLNSETKIAGLNLKDEISVEDLLTTLDVYPLIIDSDPPTASTKGYTKQMYFDIENATFYVCRGTIGTGYLWEEAFTSGGDLSGYVPETRKIAGRDLTNDITISTLGSSLRGTYNSQNIENDFIGRIAVTNSGNPNWYFKKAYICGEHNNSYSKWFELLTEKNIQQEVDENSTDEQIPSAKAVKSYVDNIVDSVNSALDEIHAYAQGIISGGVTE